MTLSDRIAALSAPDRAMDAEIMAAIYPDKVPSPIVESGYGWRLDKSYWWLATGEDSRCPCKMVVPITYTASIDDALTLLPDGCYPQFSKVSKNEWRVHLGFANRAVGIVAKAPTLAIAICVVALRERGL